MTAVAERRPRSDAEINRACNSDDPTQVRFHPLADSGSSPILGVDPGIKDAAVVCSIALQHGVPVEVIRHALLRDSQDRAASPLGAALDAIAGKERT